MAVSAGNNINSSEYNDIVTTINTVLGHGSGTSGYGQNTGLAHVAGSNTVDITAPQLESLRTAINTANNHQSASDAAIGQIYSGNIIGADASNTTTGNSVTRSSSDTFSIDNPANNKGLNDFETAANLCNTNKDSFGGTSLSTTTVYDYLTPDLTFTSNWQQLEAVVQASFAGGYESSNSNGASTTTATQDDHRRHFFNAGGKVLINTRVTNNSGAKSNDWNTIIEAVGTVTISATGVSASSGTTSLSYRQLDTSYQTILSKSGSSGVYAENEYLIQARIQSNGVLQFRIRFNDNDAGDQTGSGPPEDENVNADIEIRVRHTVPTSGIVVSPATWSIPTALASY